jgi:hypothetical protein
MQINEIVPKLDAINNSWRHINHFSVPTMWSFKQPTNNVVHKRRALIVVYALPAVHI